MNEGRGARVGAVRRSQGQERKPEGRAGAMLAGRSLTSCHKARRPPGTPRTAPPRCSPASVPASQTVPPGAPGDQCSELPGPSASSATLALGSAVPSAGIMFPTGLPLPKRWPGLAPRRQTSRQQQHLRALETDTCGRAVASWHQNRGLAAAPGRSVPGVTGTKGRGQASAFLW